MIIKIASMQFNKPQDLPGKGMMGTMKGGAQSAQFDITADTDTRLVTVAKRGAPVVPRDYPFESISWWERVVEPVVEKPKADKTARV